jgi:uncharacterized membrane protein YecN with MAPEG domain
MPKVVASEIGRAQTLHVFVCSQAKTADRPMHVWGCDITRDQVRELKFVSGI